MSENALVDEMKKIYEVDLLISQDSEIIDLSMKVEGNKNDENYLHIKSEIEKIDSKKRIYLLEILDQIYILTTTPNTLEKHVTYITLIGKLFKDWTEYLPKELILKYRRNLHKEIQFFKMKPDTSIFYAFLDLIKAHAYNLSPITNSQYHSISSVVFKLLDYRLSTLTDEEAWDFLAQSILDIE